MKTLLLDRSTWDLCKDIYGNIALADEPYAVAQDVASAIRLFQGELWYDTSKGVPYLTDILGQVPSLSVMKEAFNQAALTVPGVIQAQTFISSVADREVQGQVQVTTDAGVILVVSGFLPTGAVP